MAALEPNISILKINVNGANIAKYRGCRVC